MKIFAVWPLQPELPFRVHAASELPLLLPSALCAAAPVSAFQLLPTKTVLEHMVFVCAYVPLCAVSYALHSP